MSGRMGRVVIGIGVGASAVRAVAVQRGVVRWAMEVECAPEDDLTKVLVELLGRAPLRRWPRPSVIAAVGASRSQTKRLVGLPPMTDATALAQLVREGASRFFLKNGVPLVTSSVRLVEPGIAWASALEAPLVQDLEEACATAKVTLRAVVPTAVVLGAALEPAAAGDAIVWCDRDVDLRITVEAGRLASVRRVTRMPARIGSDAAPIDDSRAMGRLAEGEHGDDGNSDAHTGAQAPRPVKPLASLGDDAMRFADAYGAALLPVSESLALRPGRDALRAAAAPRWRRTVAECACILSVTAALLAPGLAATRASRAAAARLATLGTQRAKAVTTARDLGRVSAALEQVAAFERSRTSATFLLQTITTTLPTGSALVTLRIDTTSGTLVALAPRAGAVVNALDHAPGIAAPEIIGPVTRETAGAAELERVTIRFRIDTVARGLAPAPARAPRDGASRDSADHERTSHARATSDAPDPTHSTGAKR